MDGRVHKSTVRLRFRPGACRCNLIAMSDVTTAPPALRWVAFFLAACAVLGLFLGFRDQIRKNPPGWYTGAEQVATPLGASPDGARDAVAFDPAAPRPPLTTAAPPQKAADTPALTASTPEEKADEAGAPEAIAPKAVPPPVLTPTPTPKLRTVPAAPRPPPSDPVGDILEGQKLSDPAPTVPY